MTTLLSREVGGYRRSGARLRVLPSWPRTEQEDEMAVTQDTERFETVIVGGGQAGLAVGYHLTRQ